jgi:hypothetical protein
MNQVGGYAPHHDPPEEPGAVAARGNQVGFELLGEAQDLDPCRPREEMGLYREPGGFAEFRVNRWIVTPDAAGEQRSAAPAH